MRHPHGLSIPGMVKCTLERSKSATATGNLRTFGIFHTVLRGKCAAGFARREKGSIQFCNARQEAQGFWNYPPRALQLLNTCLCLKSVRVSGIGGVGCERLGGKCSGCSALECVGYRWRVEDDHQTARLPGRQLKGQLAAGSFHLNAHSAD